MAEGSAGSAEEEGRAEGERRQAPRGGRRNKKKKSYKGGDIVNNCIKRVQTYSDDVNSEFVDYDRLFNATTGTSTAVTSTS